MMSWTHPRRWFIGTLAVAACVAFALSRGDAADHGRLLDRHGTPITGDFLGKVVDPALANNDLVLTVDLELQKLTEQAVAEHDSAAVVVVEVDTGRILALVSPERAYHRTFAPASTFKLVTAVAGLESGMASRHEQMTCTGQRTVGSRVMRDMEVHGTVDFLDALQHSCNIYFWKIGERVGIDRLAAVARDFGYGSRTGIALAGESAGQLPDSGQYGTSDEDSVKRINAAIGSGDVRATVLQVAMAYAALANGGRLYAPQIVRRVQSPTGAVIEQRSPVQRRRVNVSPGTLELVRKGMWRAVNSRGGTAIAAKRGAVKIIGKTGTSKARNLGEDSNAWFAGFAPAEHPQIAVVVMVEQGGIGGRVAAPLARDIIDGYFTRIKR